MNEHSRYDSPDDNQSSNKFESVEKSGYANKTVLITGHTGFKGSWLTLWLSALDAHIVGYSLKPNTQPNIFEACNLEKRITHIIGDIRDEEHLTEVVQKTQPEFVFHLAAQPLVRLSYEDPKYTYETNIMGLVNLLEAVRKTDSVHAVINVTSDKCYENREWIWGYRENDPMGGHDPYSSSKGCSELITSSYRMSFFNANQNVGYNTSLASARAGNVIGGGDWAHDRIIPDCIRALTRKEKISIRNPHAQRPWQHVLEPISGYLWLGLLLRHYGAKYSSSWNFGPKENQAISVSELVNRIIQIWGEGDWFSQKNTHKQLHEASYLKLDISKAYQLLNWFPLYNANEALNETIKWYSFYYQGNGDLYNLSLEQLRGYIGKAKESKISWSNYLDFSL